ncbi:MAG: GNAT family N-acetyltransferase, partial [Cyanobacteria bacterium P01_E01_bin.6]
GQPLPRIVRRQMIVSQVFDLPRDTAILAELARLEGHRNIDRLVADYDSGDNRFDLPGEALFILQSKEGASLGIGGINIDPYFDEPSIGRARRLYIHPEYRRMGLGALLVQKIEAHASTSFSSIQLYTASPEASAFYKSLGYKEVFNQTKVSHAKTFRRIEPR